MNLLNDQSQKYAYAHTYISVKTFICVFHTRMFKYNNKIKTNKNVF